MFEPRRRVREEIESEIRSFGLCATSVDTLADAVRELESEEVDYAALVIHSATRDSRSMDVVEFFTRSENRLAKLPQVRVPRVWSRTELQHALTL